MRADVLLLLAAIVACVYGQQSLYLNQPGNTGSTTIFSSTQSATLWLSLIGYPCTTISCQANQCSHKYCATDANGNCLSSGNEQWTTVAGNLAFTFACCKGTTCGQPPQAGGFVTFTPNQSAGVSYTGPRSQCYPVGSNGQTYTSTFDWSYSLTASTIMSKCGSGYDGWRPVLGESIGNVPAGSSSVQVSISSINNIVDPIFYNASVAIVSAGSAAPAAPAASTYYNGPTAGVYQTVDCGQAAQINPPPACATTASCSGSCGCGYIAMLNRTYNANGCGTGCPTTTFLFQVCLLCDFGFSYLAICNAAQGGTVIVGMGGSGSNTYVGSQCTYTIGTGGKTISGCTAIKWAGPCSWAKGQCDYFPVTLAGDVSDYTFNFNLHAGQGPALQVIELNTGTCPYGTCPDGSVPTTTGTSNFGSCPCPTIPPPTTPPPPTTAPPTTPPAPTTTAPPTTPPSTEGGTTAPPDTTIATPTTPTPTTEAPTPSPTTPTPTTPNNCPAGICSSASGSCDECCYTDPSSSVQSYCIPDANGLTYTQTFIVVSLGQTVPSNAIRPNGTTPGGCQLDCQCNVALVSCNCSATIDTACICNQCTGACQVDASCHPPSTPPAGTTCAPCPVSDTTGLECSGNGFCDCGVCVCSASRNVTGLACDTPTGPGQFTNCADCVVNSDVWCDSLGIFSCTTAADCASFNGIATTQCDYVPPLLCQDNCTCPDAGNSSHGHCVTEDGVAQCLCKKGWHGGACCATGGLSKGAIAGIAGGAIAGIVIAGLVAFAVIGYAAKKGVDWVALRSQNMAAAHDNPMFKARTTEHENPLHSA